jgi:TetR/AcrR family transcriptional repressor of nem operon
MKKSKLDTAETKRRIVSTASTLFLQNGLAETGIADVMEAAGLTQGGFYRHFESKDELIAEANRVANAKLFDFYSAAIEGKQALEAMEIIARLYLYQSQGNELETLCPLANLGSELRHANDHIRSVAMEGYQRLAETFTMMAKQVGIADHASVADSIVSTIVGAVTLSRLSVDKVTAESILENALATVRTLLHVPPQSHQQDQRSAAPVSIAV